MSIEFHVDSPIVPNLREWAMDVKRRQLPRDVARCHGLGAGNILCDRRDSCLRYVDPPFCTENLEHATWFLPDLKLGEYGCEEFIGED